MEISGTVVDSVTMAPLAGAIVSYVYYHPDLGANNYVTNSVADKDGRFLITAMPMAKMRLEIAHPGYRVAIIPVNGGQSKKVALGNIRLGEDVNKLDEIVVRSRLQLYKMRGDTMIIVPNAVKTMRGDAIVEVLRRIPGVQVLDSGDIMIGDKRVERTYINDRLIFGEDPRAALKHVKATSVAEVQVYDEVDQSDAVSVGEDKARRRKVLNLVTYGAFDNMLSMAASAAYGADFAEDKAGAGDRYDLSGEVNYFSEKRQAGVYITGYNTAFDIFGGDYYRTIGGNSLTGVRGRQSPDAGYNRDLACGVSYAGSDRSSNKYQLNYDYAFARAKSWSSSLSEYTDQSGRVESDTLGSGTEAHTHTGLMDGMRYLNATPILKRA